MILTPSKPWFSRISKNRKISCETFENRLRGVENHQSGSHQRGAVSEWVVRGHGAKHSPSPPGGDFPLRVLMETFIFWVPFWACFSWFSGVESHGITENNKKSNSSIPKQYHIQSPVSPCDQFRWSTAGFREFSGFMPSGAKHSPPSSRQGAPSGKIRGSSYDAFFFVFKPIFSWSKRTPETKASTSQGFQYMGNSILSTIFL